MTSWLETMKTNRRFFNAGLVSAPFVLGASGRAEAKAETDIAIIGAGAAGLTAAHRAREKGLTARIYEARPRVGGRVFTDASLGAEFEAGAFFIHFGPRNPWREVAHAFEQKMLDEAIFRTEFEMFRNGERLSSEDRQRRRSAYSRLAARIEEEGNGDDISFAAAAREFLPDVAENIRNLTLMSVGEEPDRVSFHDYDRLDYGGDLVLPGGYGRLLEAYARGLDIRLSTPVTAIDLSGSGVRLSMPGGSVEARAVIVTVPVNVLKAGAIRFTPGLPNGITRALDGLGMGALSKVAFRVDARFGVAPWTQYVDVGAPGETIHFGFYPFERPLIVAHFGGDYARKLNAAGEKTAIEAIKARLVAILGAEAQKHITGASHAGWSADPFSLGGYSFVRPGRIAARDALEAPVEGKLFFAGEANAGIASMTAGGAALSARRAVDEAARRLATRPGTGD